jgi:hypothetical protein
MPLTLFDLPHTAWDRVAHFLTDDLETLPRLSSFSRDLQAICRPYSSAHFRRAVPEVFWKHEWLQVRGSQKTHWANHGLLHLVLNGDIDPKQILDYHCNRQYTDYNYEAGEKDCNDDTKHYPNRFVLTPTTRPRLPRPGFDDPTEKQTEAYDRLVISAIVSSQWISPEERDQVFERFRTGDQDAAGIILLPLLTSLKAVNPPIKGGLCSELFRKVARVSQSLSLARCGKDTEAGRPSVREPDDESKKLPFSELLIFYLEGNDQSNLTSSFWLPEIRPFLGIPSLQRIILHGVRDWELDSWPPELPPITCREIYLSQSSVHQDAIMKFSEGISGPCTLRQWYQQDNWNFRDASLDMGWEPDWDHLHVRVGPTGERQVWVSDECKGGIDGTKWPWVSWLWHRHMQDWEMLDQPFHGDESDKNVFDLTLSF